MTKISERLIYLRGKESRRSFADFVGVKESTWRNYEKGNTQPPAELLGEICKKLRISPLWLLMGEGEKTPPEHLPLLPNLSEEKIRLAALEDERRELSTENRQLWKENASLRERVARLEEQVKALRIAPAAPPMGASPPTAPVSAQHAPLPGPANR